MQAIIFRPDSKQGELENDRTLIREQSRDRHRRRLGTGAGEAAALRAGRREGRRRRGDGVGMLSTAGLKGWRDNAAYSASKHAIMGLVRSAAEAFAARGVRVNLICPGTIRTRMFVANPGEDLIVPAAELEMPPFS